MLWESMAVQLLFPIGVCLGFFFGFVWDLRCEKCKFVGAVSRGHGWTGVPKNVHIGRWDMVSATEGRSDMSGVPCYRCAQGAGGKNWPKRKKVPRTLIIR